MLYSSKSYCSLRLVAIALICLALAACAKPASPPLQGGLHDWMESVQDLQDFPQNLEVFAAEAGANRRLMSQSQQDRAYVNFNRVFFGAWSQTRTSIRAREVAAPFARARGYKDGRRVWSQPEWDAMRANANLDAFPSRALPAITLRATNLRELPTEVPRFSEPTPDSLKNPFDYFQYSQLPPGTPILIAHTTRDGQWHYIECPVAGGWVSARDVGTVNEEFRRVWRSGSFVALVRDNVTLPDTGRNGRDSVGGIGTILPLKGRIDGYQVLLPVAGRDGSAQMAETVLSSSDAAPMPMPLTAGNVARIGDAMMGQPYGWGGMNGNRDCSAMMRDLFAPFGLWLPRNSQAQAQRGQVVSLANMPHSEKERVILKEGTPFLSLLGMRGHIGLYVGAWHGRPAMFHNVWGLRVIRDDNDDARRVLGRAVVTSITPGMELDELYRETTFVDRLRSLTTLDH